MPSLNLTFNILFPVLCFYYYLHLECPLTSLPVQVPCKAFENTSSNGYTTEKLYQPLQAFSIPIYWGNPLVVRDFNPKAFINCNDYDNDFDAIINRVKEIDKNPDLYLSILRENPMQKDFDFDQNKKFERWLINIIEKGNKPFNKDPHHRDSIHHIIKQKNKKRIYLLGIPILTIKGK